MILAIRKLLLAILIEFFVNGDSKIINIVYNEGDLYVSNHRPIKALFDFSLNTINLKEKEKVENTLFSLSHKLSRSILSKINDPFDTGDGTIVPEEEPDMIEESIIIKDEEIQIFIDSISVVANKFKENKEDNELIKACINLLNIQIKSLLNYLSQKNNEIALTLIQLLENLFENLVNQVKLYLNNNEKEF